MRATGVARATAHAVRLTPTSPTDIERDLQQLQIAIGRRAYELFEERGREHGHDWEDWFQAESEFAWPVSVAISESDRRISVRLNVLGFEGKELKLSVEPTRLMLFGAKNECQESKYPKRTFCVLQLPAEVDPSAAAIVLESGVVKAELFKAAAANTNVSPETNFP